MVPPKKFNFFISREFGKVNLCSCKDVSWDRIPTDHNGPFSKLLYRAIRYPGFFSGSVKRGSCGSDFLDLFLLLHFSLRGFRTIKTFMAASVGG